MGGDEAGSQYSDDFISMVSSNKAWSSLLQEFGWMLVLIQVHSSTCICKMRYVSLMFEANWAKKKHS